MSLFLQTLILRGIILFREQEHRQEHMNLGGRRRRRQAVLKTGNRFAGAGELKNAASRPAFGVTSIKSRFK